MHSLAHHHRETGKESVHETRGLVMNWGWPYDLMVWFFDTVVFHGKLQALRTKTADLAQLQRGEAVLDVGCGTGTQALKAYERVGETGHVSGIDPAPRQIARARSKAARRNFPIDFQIGVIEQLAIPDQSFDVVLSTLMMHHLPDDLKRQGLSEIARVLKPGGRLLIVDFKSSQGHRGRRKRLGAGEMDIQDLPTLMKDAGFSQIESGEMDTGRINLFKIGFAQGRKG
jgi:ubiquinone/menaquinone biosynthesis C-methylase UbiE